MTKITAIKAAGLRGSTPEGGWANEIKSDDCIHTLIAVYTDQGITGWGSSFTNDLLVEGALRILEPLLIGENALEPERVSEKLHANTFWMGRGGSITHAISGIDIALWDILGKATGQPVGRLLGGRYRERVLPYASLLMQEPEPLARTLACCPGAGFSCLQDRLGSVWTAKQCFWTNRSFALLAKPSATMRCSWWMLVRAMPFGNRDISGRSRTADMLADYGVKWFEEPLPPDNLPTTCCCGEIRAYRSPAAKF